MSAMNPRQLTADQIIGIIQRRRNVYANFCTIVPGSEVAITVKEYDVILRNIEEGKMSCTLTATQVAPDATKDTALDE